MLQNRRYWAMLNLSVSCTSWICWPSHICTRCSAPCLQTSPARRRRKIVRTWNVWPSLFGHAEKIWIQSWENS
uniref:Putative secreted protein n=1 Tax=Anopheles darlingi TaxID=43151 RepID=A0A2M4DRA6_ANODA